jgi:hypothetical protein
MQPDKVLTATLHTDIAELRLCVFTRCQHGTTVTHDCYQSTPGDSPPDAGAGAPSLTVTDSGFRGCCRIGKGSVSAIVQCGTLPGDQGTEGFVWVDSGSSLNVHCARYSVDYSFHQSPR